MKVHAPFDAATLAHMLGLHTRLYATSPEERLLFAKQLLAAEHKISA
jgi:hypothetical protein